MIVNEHKNEMDEQCLAMIENHIDDLDTSYLDFVNNFMDERPKVYLYDGGLTFLAFLESYTGIEGIGALRTFLSDLVKESKALTWDTIDKYIYPGNKEFKKKTFRLEELLSDLKYDMKHLWGVEYNEIGLDNFFEYQVKGYLPEDIAGYECLMDKSVQELRETGIDWYVPVDVHKTECPGVELLKQKSKDGEMLRCLCHYTQVDPDGTIHLNKVNDLYNTDYSSNLIFVPLSKIVDGDKDSNTVATWLKKEDALLLGYNVL